MKAPTRRGALGTTTTAVASGIIGQATAPAVAVNPDAELVDACHAFDRLERAYIAEGGRHPPGSSEEEASEALRDHIALQQRPLAHRIAEMRATTREGMAARARSLALWAPDVLTDGEDLAALLTGAIVRDLLDGAP